jgi:L-seryl-tRNA(Ser) seleniumtransferase
VASAAFKAVGCGDPAAAGSIPVHLRRTIHIVSTTEGERPPSVERLAQQLAPTGLPHPLLVDVARRAIAAKSTDPAAIAACAADLAARERLRLLQPVINATGVLLHTNLGRAPLAVDRPAGYTNLELDLSTGRRGNRSTHAASLLAHACGAEAALVVNNGASALHLALAALAAGSEVVVSRGELVEIGGGFRIPDVMAASGAVLVEVGTTNRTRPEDYQAALGPETGILLKVHTSNYRMTGFVSSVDIPDLVAVQGARRDVAVVADLGSGLLDSGCPWLDSGPPEWLGTEPAVRQTLAAGADLVTFSCDKLLGGPQGGVIAGNAKLIERCRRHPLARVVRAGGLVLEALQDVALAYLRRDAGQVLPLWRLATTPVADLRRRADALEAGKVVDCSSVMGGGTLPGVSIPSAGVAFSGDVTAVLRAGSPPVLARVVAGSTVCDLRTVFPDQDEQLASLLKESGLR